MLFSRRQPGISPGQFRKLVEVLRAELEGLRVVLQEQKCVICAGDEAQRDALEQIRTAILETRTSESENKERQSYRKKNYAVQKILTIATVGAFIAAGIYAAIAARELDQIKKANTLAQEANNLSRMLVSGTEGAQVPQPTVYMEQSELVLRFRNIGKVPALHLAGDIEISKHSLPDYKQIGPGQKFTIEISQVPVVLGPSPQRFIVAGFGKADAYEIEQGRETITVRGAFTYDNGFGIMMPETFCVTQMTVHYFKNAGQWSGWPDCQDMRSNLKMALPPDQRWGQEWNSKHQ